MAVDAQSGSFSSGFLSVARRRLKIVDSVAWRRFFLALLALSFSLFLALDATALSQSGRYRLAAVLAALSLLLAGLVAVRAVPALARRTALRRWMIKVEFQFTRAGTAYLAVIAVIAVAALNTGNNLLFIILSCMLAAILASGVLSRVVLQQLELDLALPEHVFAGQTFPARLRLANRKQLLPTFSVTISSSQISRRDRSKRPSPARPAIPAQTVYFPYVPRRSTVSQEVKLTFPRRGRYLQDGLRISTRFPFGFLRKTRSLPSRQEVLVLPGIQYTERLFEVLPLIGSKQESYQKGRSHDLYAIRDYRQSDSARDVDWKATARVRQLKVREFTREDESRVRLVFDRRVPDATPRTLERFEKAVAMCAGLAGHFYETRVRMSFVTDDFETPMSPASDILFPVLEKLAVVEPAVTERFLSCSLFGDSSGQEQCFQIVLTYQPRGSIPGGLWNSSYILFMNTL